MIVAVELAGDVSVVGRHVGQGFVTVAACTETNLTFVQAGQSLVMVSVELGGVTVAGVLDSVFKSTGPGILIGGQVGQALCSVSPDPGIVIGGQVGQGVSTVSTKPD